jgi:3-oxoacyl-[acyl-carrier-protein] synthase II
MLTVNKPIYIRSAAAISPRQGEPDYRTLLDPKLIRRMSRVIRMGAGAALICLREAAVACGESGQAMPDAIVTGTAYGCLEDTGLFLKSMIERNEEMLQPATFIQSTHNTVGAQIALLLQCTGYNNTFVHRGFSFESALLDASLLLADDEAATVLVGGVDEITDASRMVLERFGFYRRTEAGEGAAFFLLAGQPSGNDLARLDAMATFYNPSTDEDIKREIRTFLEARGLVPEDVDMIVTGDNGDEKGDRVYREISRTLFPGILNFRFKEICGEYPTAASFCLWQTADMVSMVREGAGRVLIYNHYLGMYHSVYLLSRAARSGSDYAG